MPVQQLDEAAFHGARKIDWFRNGDAPGDEANLADGAYVNAASGRAVTVVRAAPTQSVVISTCSPAGLPTNSEPGVGLLLASNRLTAPVRLRWSQGVRSVGTYVVAQALDGTPFAAVMWVWLEGAAQWESVRVQGMTGGIVVQAGDRIAPFVGAQAPAGDTITSVYFDAVHPSDQEFSPLGIGRLYFREA